MAVKVLSGKVFLLITGASQGIGRQIAVTFSELLEPGSKLLLLARSENGLKETAHNVSKRVSVDIKGVDLAVTTADQLSEIITKSVNQVQFDRIIVVHNVGSIGDVSKFTTDMSDFEEWRKYYDLNVFSPAILNSVVMKLFKDNTKAKKIVINITSFAAIQPMKSVGYYCSGKAAREMYFKVFAEEYPDINVLNYSPGPVDTAMLKTFCTTAAYADQRKRTTDIIANNQILTTEQTVNRLVEVLRDQKYNSGAFVDYYDGTEKARPRLSK
ncbi:sepiapterin reductase [Diachasma alloeum]|uniref:sepiapterin reductase n=1 Tax=Diachasma alloeum TaxID=454923 RepID=UPI0007384C23|nr:sepiapterin reductase [Diachasma alloeum]